MWVKPTIGEQRKVLTALFEPPMHKLAEKCAETWSDINLLDNILINDFASIPHSHLLYAIDKFGKQTSSNVSANGLDTSYRGQDLSRRPYSVSLYPKRDFTLSSVYISQTTGCPCISAVQPVLDKQQFLGFIVADFDIRHLPVVVSAARASTLWQQESPSHPLNPVPRRINSLLDKYVDDVMSVLDELICYHGVFHCTLHYGSNQVMLWQTSDPYKYHLYSVEQLLDPDIILTYPRCAYPTNAILHTRHVRPLLEKFKALRLADESMYLRSGSVNTMNGMVGLTFSSEGSQYMAAEVFLGKDLSAWLGKVVVNAN